MGAGAVERRHWGQDLMQKERGRERGKRRCGKTQGGTGREGGRPVSSAPGFRLFPSKPPSPQVLWVNHIPSPTPKRCGEALPPRTSEYDLIWQEGHGRCR